MTERREQIREAEEYIKQRLELGPVSIIDLIAGLNHFIPADLVRLAYFNTLDNGYAEHTRDLKLRKKRITLNRIKEEVDVIERIAKGDVESAHGREDKLWQSVLETIASMGGEQGELAEAALKTKDLDFSRYCA